MANFSVEIANFVKKTKDREARFIREFSQDLAEEVIKETPVQTGFLRSSWSAAIGAPDTGQVGIKGTIESPSDPSGAFSRIALNLLGVKGGDTIFISNNAEYAPHVEYGTSRMAARAFVRRTLARANQIALNAFRRVMAGG